MKDLALNSDCFFQILFNSASEGIVITDQSGVIQMSNPKANEIFGTQENANNGTNIIDFFDVSEREKAIQHFQKISNGIPVQNICCLLVKKNGERFYREIKTNVVKNKDLKPSFILLSIHDITTKNNHLENLLRLSEEEDTKVFHTSPDAITINRLSDGVFVDVNEGFMKVSGYSREELIGNSSFHNDTGMWVNLYERDILKKSLLLHGEIVGLETSLRKKGGMIISVLVTAKIIEVGGEKCNLCIIRDITHSKMAEETIRKNTENLKLLNELEVGIFTAKSQEGIYHSALLGTHKIIPCSQATISIFDFENNSVNGITSYLNHENFITFENIPYNYKLEGEQSQNSILGLLLIKEYLYIPVLCNEGLNSYLEIPLISNNKILGSFKLFSDKVNAFSTDEIEIAKEIAIELSIAINQARLLKKAQDHAMMLEQHIENRTIELENAVSEQEEFCYTLSHDLRAPLRAINGYSQILMEDYGCHLDKEAMRYLHLISDNTLKLGQLVDDLLQFSRLGRKGVVRVHTSIKKIAENVLEELEDVLKGREIEFIIDSLEDAYVDPSLTKQVFTNLISNAIKFTRPTDKPVILIGSKKDRGQKIYYVKDNGIGFDMNYADKIYGVFQRLHVNDQYEGTGVGLAIVKRIIDKHGGQIWADSIVNKGTTFYCTFQ